MAVEKIVDLQERMRDYPPKQQTNADEIEGRAKRSANLADLDDKAAARANLDVWSRAQGETPSGAQAKATTALNDAKAYTDAEVDAAVKAGAVNPRGDWSAATAYAALDAVYHSGRQWYANPATVAGEEPGISAKWHKYSDGLDETTATDRFARRGTVHVEAHGAVDATGVADSTAAFVAAGTAAAAVGATVTARPGTYHCPGMDAADMSNAYIVGDGIKFTPTTYVAAFSHRDWIGRGNQDRTQSIGRGAIALEVDDALAQQWETLLPLTKKLGIPIGVAWPTGNATPWVREMWRHGWELLAHGVNHENMSTLTLAEVETLAAQSLDSIEAITGVRDNVSFVYPNHGRTDETDRVLSKYFARGRGQAGPISYQMNAGHRWLITAYAIDTAMSAGAISDALKRTLRAVANSNSRMVLYFHWNDNTFDDGRLDALVAYARSLGIAIVHPGSLIGGTRVSDDPYFDDTALWTLDANTTWDTVEKYHGVRSAKFEHATTWAGPTITGPVAGLGAAGPAGLFSVYRASFRYKVATDLTISSGWGLAFELAARGRTLTADDVTTQFDGAYREIFPKFPESGTVIPAGTWVRVARSMILGPDVTRATMRLRGANIANNSGNPLRIDELKVELVDRVSSMKYAATLNGTGGVFVDTGILLPSRYGITVTPRGSVAGRIYYTVANTGRITVFSTDAADTATVDVVVTPTLTYADLAWPSTGA